VKLGGGEVALRGGRRCEQVGVRARAAGRAAIAAARDDDSLGRAGVRRVYDRTDCDGDGLIAVGLSRVDLGGLAEQVGHAERVDRAHRPVHLPVFGDSSVTRRYSGEGVGDRDLAVVAERDEVTRQQLRQRVLVEAEATEVAAVRRAALREAIENQCIELA
jgi:hypothetical protein